MTPHQTGRPLRIFVLAASLRKDSLNRKLAELAAGVVRAQGAEVDLASMHDFDVPLYDGDGEGENGIPAGAAAFRARLSAADGFIIHHRKAVLVATTPQGELPIEIALWDDGWEMGETWTLVGVLSAPPKTNGAVVLRSDGSGPAPGIEARQGSLRVMTVRHGEWQEAFLRNANVIEATIAHDAVVAAACDLARTDTGTGGPGANAPVCRDREPDQDVVAAAFTLQWDGAAIHELP